MYIVTAKKDAQDAHSPTVLQWTPTQESDADPRIRRESKHMRMSLVHTAPLTPLSERHHILAPRLADHPDEFKSAT